jgi:hypothetical protein
MGNGPTVIMAFIRWDTEDTPETLHFVRALSRSRSYWNYPYTNWSDVLNRLDKLIWDRSVHTQLKGSMSSGYATFVYKVPRLEKKQRQNRRMVSSGMLRRVALVRTDVSEVLSACFIRVTRVGELGTALAVTSNRRTLLVTASVVPSSPILVTLMKDSLSSFLTSVLTRVTRRNIPEDSILHSHCRVKTSNLTQRRNKFYRNCPILT